MSFKLENIKIETEEGEQEIIGEHDFSGKLDLNVDRTYCLFNVSGCRPDDSNCECNTTSDGEKYTNDSCPKDSNRSKRRSCDCQYVTRGDEGQRVCKDMDDYL